MTPAAEADCSFDPQVGIHHSVRGLELRAESNSAHRVCNVGVEGLKRGAHGGADRVSAEQLAPPRPPPMTRSLTSASDQLGFYAMERDAYAAALHVRRAASSDSQSTRDDSAARGAGAAAAAITSCSRSPARPPFATSNRDCQDCPSGTLNFRARLSAPHRIRAADHRTAGAGQSSGTRPDVRRH